MPPGLPANPPRRVPLARPAAIACTLLLGVAAPTARGAEDLPDRTGELARMRSEISRLEQDLATLRGREEGVLGELRKLETEIRLREAEDKEVSLRLEEVTSQIERRDGTVKDLARAQERRRSYLAFRLREIYKAGPEQALRRFLGGEEAEDYWSALAYAVFLNERDSEVLREYRADSARLEGERAELVRARDELAAARAKAGEARAALLAARGRQARALAKIRDDRSTRQEALDELEAAARELTRRIEEAGPGEAVASADVRGFRGRLDWPARGPIGAAFGTVVHPRFKTEVPHPGWDILAPYGSDITSIFDGQVVFADWMRGYGLTTIVDHGGGLLSIYAHASVLMVHRGERVRRGQTLGKVGDTGSLRGAYLYFELRVDGEPTDPAGWLRPGPGADAH